MDEIIEFNPKPLSGIQKKFICIPESFLNYHDKTISVLIFMLFRKGIDDQITTSLPFLIAECGYTYKKNKKEFIDILDNLISSGYIICNEDVGNKITNIKFNTEKLNKEIKQNYFGMIFYDEYLKILNYPFKNKHTYYNQSFVLLLFCYLRFKIICRSNVLKAIDNCSSISQKKKLFPDAYNCTIKSIKEDLNIPEKSIIKLLDVLVELKLIYIKPITINKNNKIFKSYIFTNFYKRNNGMLLQEGKSYYETEVINKINLLKNKKGEQYNEQL